MDLDDSDEFFDDEDDDNDDNDELMDDIDFINEILPNPFTGNNLEALAAAIAVVNSQEPNNAAQLNAERQTIQEFQLDAFVRILMDLVDEDDGSRMGAIVHAHLAKYVPILYKTTDNPVQTLIEDKDNVQAVLFKPIEMFIVNDAVLPETKSKLCGRMFKTGEPSYSCRDCEVDPTCVLCWMCFKNSEHRLHKYKMMTSSGGGGYCDCGDVEAWKEHASCTIHTSVVDSNTKQDCLPADVDERARRLCKILFDYICTVLLAVDDLPTHMQADKHTEDDDYVVWMYNDEIHSYDHVVSTLKTSVGCDDKKAFTYATVVDKEGRSVIRRGTRAVCTKVHEMVRRTDNNRIPLTSKVMHAKLAAHQYFAEQLIKWLQAFTKNSKGLQRILVDVGFHSDDAKMPSKVQALMLADTLLWKSARTVVHQFFIAIYFMDHEWKKAFAVLYSRCYRDVWRKHVHNMDDMASVTELSVQLFTVLSLSKYLLENENLLQTMVDTLIEYAQIRLNNKQKLAFAKDKRSKQELGNALQIINDIKYCLISAPNELTWTDKLRGNFINGFKSFVKFLTYMQGMDEVKHQTNQHIEHDPEWDTAYILLIRLHSPINLLIEWCISDVYVLEQCVSHLVTCVNNEKTFEYMKIRSPWSNHGEYAIIDNDINIEHVSIHSPLSRLLAALCVEASGRTQFSAISFLSGTIKVNEFVEPALSSLVLVSQTNSGLWRRNGDALNNQVHFYFNIKCRGEMYDRDVETLQIAAALMDPNELIVNMLARFKLLDYWTKDCCEGKIETSKFHYLNPICEDFLQLIIILVRERYAFATPPSDYDKLQNEVIHQLCIQPAISHSDLIRNLFPENKVESDLLNNFESILKQVADFKQSNDPSKKGTYELKPEYYKEYNPYHYHYTKVEKTKSDDEVLKYNQTKGSQSSYYVPSMNNVPTFGQAYVAIRSLLDCDILVHILNKVIERHASKSSANNKDVKVEAAVTDGQLLCALYLIAMALNEEKQNGVYDGMTTTVAFVAKLKHLNYYDSLKSCLAKIKVGVNYKALIDYVQSGLYDDATAITSVRDSERTTAVNLKAEKRRKKILAQMSAMQNKFIQSNKDYFQNIDKTGGCDQPLSSTVDDMDTTNPLEESPSTVDIDTTIKQQHQQTTNNNNNNNNCYQCILCQESEVISFDSQQQIVLCCHVEYSKVLAKPRTSTLAPVDDPLFMSQFVDWGIHTTSCGHVMHAQCWQKYVDTTRANENRRNHRFLRISPKRNEYFCPLCETLGNTVLCVTPVANMTTATGTQDNSSYRNLIGFLETFLEMSTVVDCGTKMDNKQINDVDIDDLLKRFQLDGNGANVDDGTGAFFTKDVVNVYDIYARSAFVFGMLQHPNDDDPRMILALFNNCAYTIKTLEQLMRCDGNRPLSSPMPVRQYNLIKNLVNYPKYYTYNSNLSSTCKAYLSEMISVLLMPSKCADTRTNIIDCDMFHMLVSMMYLMRYVCPKLVDNLWHRHLLKLIVRIHVVQIVINLVKHNDTNASTENVECIDDTDPDKQHYDSLRGLHAFVMDQVQGWKNELLPVAKVVHIVRTALTTFLRCSILFFQHFAKRSAFATPTDQDETFEAYCTYLGLNPCELFDFADLRDSIGIWCGKCDTTVCCAAPLSFIQYPIEVNRLFDLPNDFIDLINNYANMSILYANDSNGASDMAPSTSILCLVCGKLLNDDNSNFTIGHTKVGACTAHAYRCSRTCGIFLRISECQILLLHLNVNADDEVQALGSFIPAPYIDDYGETDQGLRRGNRLKLCPQRYNKLNQLWLTHSIPDEICRAHQFIPLPNIDWLLL